MHQSWVLWSIFAVREEVGAQLDEMMESFQITQRLVLDQLTSCTLLDKLEDLLTKLLKSTGWICLVVCIGEDEGLDESFRAIDHLFLVRVWFLPMTIIVDSFWQQFDEVLSETQQFGFFTCCVHIIGFWKTIWSNELDVLKTLEEVFVVTWEVGKDFLWVITGVFKLFLIQREFDACDGILLIISEVLVVHVKFIDV